MKKIAFTLGAVTAVCACSLVIDPEKLVEGSASPIDSSIDGGVDGADAATPDAPADGPTLVEVPECVPAAPSGTQGPYAVTFGGVDTKVACPSGYLASPVATAKGALQADGIVCGDATGCGCSASGTATCSVRLRYFSDSQCKNGEQGSSPLSASCRDIDSANYLKAERVATGVTCANSGASTVAPTTKPAPAYREDWVVCALDPGVSLAQCKAGQVPLPPAKNAGACVIASGTACPAPYSEAVDLSKSGTFADARACACGCDAGASCIGGSATIFSDNKCEAAGKPFALDTCLPRSGDDSMTAVLPSPASQPACTATVVPTGTVNANNDLRLCCLP